MTIISPTPPVPRKAFSLVELLVVIGIIALLMGMLMPALSRARFQANSVACKAHLKEIGTLLLIYANNNNGVLYPIGSVVKSGEPWFGSSQEVGKYRTLGNGSYYANGTLIPRQGRWPVYVFPEETWNPKILICPQDQEVLSSSTGEQHSYLLNHHLEEKPETQIKYGASIPGRTFSDIVWMGEKTTSAGDYYMEEGDFYSSRPVVEKFRHGLNLGSNYLYLDNHVDTVPSELVAGALDPWAPVAAKPAQ